MPTSSNLRPFFGVFGATKDAKDPPGVLGSGHGGDQCTCFIARRISEELAQSGMPDDAAVTALALSLEKEFLDKKRFRVQYAVGDVGVVVDIATLAGMMQPVSSKILKKLGFESHHRPFNLVERLVALSKAHFVPLRVTRNYKNLIIKQVDTRHVLKSNNLKTQLR